MKARAVFIGICSAILMWLIIGVIDYFATQTPSILIFIAPENQTELIKRLLITVFYGFFIILTHVYIARYKKTLNLPDKDECLSIFKNGDSYDLLYVKDADGNYLEINNSFLQFFDIRMKNYFGKSSKKISETANNHKDFFEELPKYEDNAWTQRKTFRIDREFTGSRGDIRFYDIMIKPLYHPNGKQKCLLFSARDITERKITESSLANRTRQLTCLFEYSQKVLRYDNIQDIMNETITTAKKSLGIDYACLREKVTIENRDFLIARAGIEIDSRFELDFDCKDNFYLQVLNSVYAGEPIIIDDFRQNNIFNTQDYFSKYGITCGLSVPVHYDNELKGMLSVFSKKKRRFSLMDISLIQSLGNYTGMSITRKINENQVRSSEKNFRQLFENSLVGFVRARGTDGKILYANNIVKEAMGVSKEKTVSLYARDYYDDPYDRDIFFTALKENGFVTNYETTFRYPNSKIVHVIINAIYFPEIDIIESTITDITQIRDHHNRILESEKRFRRLYENAPVSIIRTLAKTGDIIFANRKARELFGIASDSPSIKSSESIIKFWKEKSRRDKFVEEVKKTGILDDYQIEFILEDGEVVSLLLNSVYYKESDVIESSITDVSMIRNLKEQYRNLYNEAQVGIVSISLKTDEVLTANRKLIEMLGVSHEGFEEYRKLKEKPPVIQKYYSNPEVRKKIIEELKKNKEVNNYELELLRKDGTPIQTIVNAKYHPEKEIVEVSIVDITKKKEIEKQLVKAKKRAEEMNRMKSDFLAKITHDLKTPLTSIMGFCDILQDEDNSADEKQTYIGIISKSANRLLKMINDILSFAKLESKEITINIEHFSLKQLLDEVISIMSPLIENKDLDFDFIYDRKIPSEIGTDPDKLSQILINLMTNAVKFTNSGKIALEVKYSPPIHTFKGDDERRILFKVIDTGVGIPFEKQNLIFSPFVQVDEHKKSTHEGTGLGLSIVESYVELLGGRIWVESEPGKGSTFLFSITITDDQPNEAVFVEENDSHSNMKIEKTEQGKKKIRKSHNNRTKRDVDNRNILKRFYISDIKSFHDSQGNLL